MNTKERNLNLDILRIFASLAVIFIHVSAQNWYNLDVLSFEWNTFNIYDSLFRWGVPIFVMISGALFLDREISISKIYTKYILRIISAFCFWSIIYATDLLQRGLITSKGNFLSKVITGNYHMWYLIMIIGIYMAIPIFRLIVKDEKITKYFLTVSFILFVLVPSLTEIYANLNIDESSPINNIFLALKNNFSILDKNLFLGYSFYFVLGYYLSNTLNKKRKYEFIFILGFIITAAISAAISIKKNEPYGFYQNNYIGVMLQSIGIFMLFNRLNVTTKASSITKLSNYTFGIYLIHPIIITYLDKWFNFNTLSFNPILSVPIVCLIVWIISMCITFIISKIPILNRYII